ncbi:TPA: hypothetical protein ACOEA2_003912 [Enterobacter cloacae]
MSQFKREPEKYDLLSLFGAMSKKLGLRINSEKSINKFLETITESIHEIQNNKRLIYGKRIESLFPIMLLALGETKLIKQEDTGDVISNGDKIRVPDYRVVTNNGESFYVEVKNHHMRDFNDPYILRGRYIKELKSYCNIGKLPLKFAIYYSSVNQWVLLDIDSFDEVNGNYIIDFADALSRNEMGLLGDKSIGMKPNLELILLANTDATSTVSESGECEFVIGDVKFKCAGVDLTSDLDKQIAFFCILYGKWIEGRAEAIIEDKILKAVVFSYEPEHEKGQGFEIIGSLSSLISNKYKALTTDGDEITATEINISPNDICFSLPENYRSEELPLWIFTFMPNPKTYKLPRAFIQNSD